MSFTNYTIVPADSVVVIDEVAYSPVDMTGIPATVHAIQWYGNTNTGKIEYKQLPDGTLPAPDSFTDPADYYDQTQACVKPLVCYATSDSSEYENQTYFTGQRLVIYQWPHSAIPADFTAVVPPVQTLTYTSLYWTGSAFVWSLFDPKGTLVDGRNVSIDYVNSEAYSILQPSDWYVVRQSENGTPIPDNWNNWRQTIRQEANDKNAGIAACASVDELLVYTTTPAFNTWTPSPA
jgi:hypothetical protein